jgi:hypothetical protein
MAGVTAARAISACMDAMDRPFEWGVADCCTSASDAFLALHGVDPMAPLRGRYRTERGARVHIARRGGFLAMAEALAAEAGLSGGNGGPGEIGVVETPEGPALAISTGSAWLAKSPRGLVSTPGAVRAWQCQQ